MSVPYEVRNSPIHGTGVFATQDIEKGVEIIYYGGKVMTNAEAEAAPDAQIDTGHTFLFTLNDDYVIEGAIGGNEARFINHSCDPNCEALVIEDEDGDPAKDQIVIESIRPIRAGEELTYDYGIETDEEATPDLLQKWKCRCGAKACRGTMLTFSRQPRPLPVRN